jgi:hypothetical protein
MSLILASTFAPLKPYYSLNTALIQAFKESSGAINLRALKALLRLYEGSIKALLRL